MNDKTDIFIMNQRDYRIPQKVSGKKRVGDVRAMGMKTKLTLTREMYGSYPLVTAKSVPTRGSHPNARSVARAGRWRQRAAIGRMSNAWTSDATCVCL